MGPITMEWRLVRLLLLLLIPGLLAIPLFLRDVSAQADTPGGPTVNTVSAGDRALTAEWSEPADTGSSAITAYDLRYILTTEDETADANWLVQEDVWSGAGDLRHTVTELGNGEQYDVQVRAVELPGRRSLVRHCYRHPGRPRRQPLVGDGNHTTDANPGLHFIEFR